MGEIALNILTGIVIAAVSAWITVQLSLKRFRKEKWWERKADAYVRVIEALHHVKNFPDRLFDAGSSGQNLPEEKEKELIKHAEKAENEIQKALDIGAILLSKEAIIRLKHYKKDLDDALSQDPQRQNYYEFQLTVLENSKKCLEDIIKISKKDLKTN
ncbi:MAG TPA: hypothetical protein VGB26_11000 [Nitrospiria bacterium]|jgi:hypothetical protein